MLSETFLDLKVEDLNINEAQRVVLVGFTVEPDLERMIQWLSEGFGVSINAVVLKYVRTSSGCHVVTRSAIISEQVEAERAKKPKRIKIPMSDEPGNYEMGQLRELLLEYLSKDGVTVRRIREILLPACLRQRVVTRNELVKAVVERGGADNESSAGFSLTTLSTQFGMQRNDFLRQVVSYGYPNREWAKDNYSIRDGYHDLLREILEELSINVGQEVAE